MDVLDFDDSWGFNGLCCPGYSGLGTSVASLGLATDDPIDVDFVVGALKVLYQPVEH